MGRSDAHAYRRPGTSVCPLTSPGPKRRVIWRLLRRTQLQLTRRNGLSGEELLRTYQTPDADQPAKTRIMRAAMQAALVQQVKPDTIHLSKRVTRIDDTHPSEIHLEFADGARAGPYDLLIGADGIRSVTREHAYPNQKLSYAGKIAYRALVPQSKLAHLPNLPQSSCWWWTPESRLFTVGLDDERFEIAAWLAEDESKGQRVSWGQKVDKHEVLGHYEHYCEEVKAIAEAADEWMEFAMFTGPRLGSVCHQGRMALVGDASHRESSLSPPLVPRSRTRSPLWGIWSRRMLRIRRRLHHLAGHRQGVQRRSSTRHCSGRL